MGAGGFMVGLWEQWGFLRQRPYAQNGPKEMIMIIL